MTFTPRQREVLRLLVRGLSNKEIAEKMFLTQGTIRWHLKDAYRILGVKSRAGAIVKIITEKIDLKDSP